MLSKKSTTNYPPYSSVGVVTQLMGLLFILICLGQPVYGAHTYYKYFDINKIHSNEVIKGISKDEQGFIWLATDQGVLRFDGEETTVFFKELPSPYTKKFLRRKNGQFLVVTDLGIKEIVHSGDTTYFKDIEVNGRPFMERLIYPKSIFEDKAGNLWIGESNAVVRVSDDGYKRFLLGDQYLSINYHRTFSFTEDAFNNIWIAPYNGRLMKYNKAEDKLEDVPIEYPLTEVTGILTYKGDHLIIGGKEGLLQLKIDSDKQIREKILIEGPQNISTVFVVKDDLYVGTWGSGLFHCDLTDKSYTFSLMEELVFNDILDFYVDEAHNEIWVTGSENIGLLKPSHILPVTIPGKYRIESMTLDNKGQLYFSTGSDLYKLDSLRDQEPMLISSSKTTYFDRILWEENKLWIGEAFGGIGYFSLENDYKFHSLDTTESAIKFIYRDKKGNKWFTGRDEGLVRIDTTETLWKYANIRKSVVIKESPDGKLYCGGQGIDSVLFIYNGALDTFLPLHIEFDFVPSENLIVEDIAFDSLRNVWMATNEGLIKVTEDEEGFRAERIMLRGIDINEPLKAIAIVNDNFWLVYSYAIAVYHNGQVIFYTRENGLPSRLLKERCFVLHEGNLYIGTAKGLAKIDVSKIDFDQTPTPLFKGIYVNGEKTPFQDIESNSVSFPYGARIQVNFVSLTYAGSNIAYQTRVLGLEDSWSEASSNSSISILGFSEGSYSLQVRARENGYLWSDPLTFSFVISSPWFKSWWAILLFIGVGAGLIYVSIKIYHFNLIHQKKKMQRIIEERTKEINIQKNEIIEQKNKIIQQKEELIEKNNAVFKSQQALSEADLNYLHLKERQLQDQIEYRNKQITTHTLNIIQKNEMLRDMRAQLEEIVKTTEGAPHASLKKLLRTIDESFRLDKDWEEFKLYFEQIYTGFYAKLKVSYPDLTNQELRHCALIRLNLNNNECASILGISPNSIKVSRTRLRKKLNLESNQSLTDFVMGI